MGGRDIPEPPHYYARLKKVNAKGAEVMVCVPRLQPLTPKEFQHAMQQPNVTVIDARSILHWVQSFPTS
ncbi:hypothetical protein [Chroococcidiopsis sp. TS-821]|uniref:hypothetical protein n=1 Tax=Chroococcidiopsis sp. TS-821 TaxID=1378066 RepID=UPI000CEE6F6A|nr:hypothetical protein [Chroococcidiopsis sp. TS-821]PPS42819.1 hypothetical protein B1A85_14010 [Chroococcidiopsis sp. TS-821]